MSENRDATDELRELLAALREDAITDSQAERLTAMLRDDAEARRTYIRYMAIAAYLRGGRIDSCASPAEPTIASDDLLAVAPSPPVVIQNPAGFPFALTPFGGFAFSYAAAAVIVAFGLLIGWVCQVSPRQSDRPEVAVKSPQANAAALRPDAHKVVVGQITGLVDCHWADPHEAPIGFDRIVLGRRYNLVSGLMEITYDTGAKVILQGPCVFAMESKTGGYLALGRATALVKKRNENEHPSGDRQPSTIGGSSPLFTIRTPTATVTDLGTEFGVEVDQSGASRAYVYQGKVELRPIDRAATDVKAVSLVKNESARVEVGNNQRVAVTREAGQPSDFVRHMPKRVRIKLFNTGVNLKEGEPDPHWQAVARSDEPNFRPRPAVMARASNSMWLANQVDRSQWISFVAGDSVLPGTAVYSFRTTFDLTGMRSATAVLHGRFVVDNHVRTIRLNGRKIPVPKHGHTEFGFFHAFSVSSGFVDGANVLEIEVENTLADSTDLPPNPMGLLVELDGSVLSAWPQSSVNASDTKNKK